MFDCLECAHQVVRSMRGLVPRIAVCDGKLADQLRRAATSVPLNVAEGRERGGRDREYHYRVALGSAAEVVSALRIARDWGYVEEAEVEEAMAGLDRVRPMLWRLTHPR